MALIPGGAFWVGSPHAEYNPEETPRFETQVAAFCMDLTEVTVNAYRSCVAAGGCKPARDSRRFCNARWEGRGEHPINCVNWSEARAYCAFRRARLPSEIEWEFAARGGSESRKYPWGDQTPDGRACWKHVGGSCEAKRFDPGAFGLYDVVGNVWEWTEDWFAPYPWPALSGTTKVYRGGGWSRRFEKWMRPQLRNRGLPTDWGSHLGFRCATTPASARCPYGRSSESPDRCRFGVNQVDCGKGKHWNGQRCAARDEPECPDGTQNVLGHGCSAPAPPPVSSARGAASSAREVSRAHTPEFDADCRRYHPAQPRAYGYSGGTHDERNAVSRAAGCRNRDVGSGWNSTCCP
jgi:hypothetical protein